MSSTGQNQRAFPTNDLNRDWTLYTDTAGMGGGGLCGNVLGVDRTVIEFDNNPFMVYNKLLILSIFLAVRPLTAGPSDFLCDITLGDPVPVYVAVSSTANLSTAEILAQNRVIPTSWDASEDDALLFTWRDREPNGAIGFIPQPTDPGYEGKTYLTLFWGNPDYVTMEGPGGAIIPGTTALDEFETVKEDFEENI